MPANEAISALTTVSTYSTLDLLELVDVTDTTFASTGTNKQITVANLLSHYFVAGTNITLSVGSSGLTINSSGGGTGTGTVYTGVGSFSMPTSTQILAMTATTGQTTFVGQWSINNPGGATYYYLIYPDDWGPVINIIDHSNGFPASMAASVGTTPLAPQYCNSDFPGAPIPFYYALFSLGNGGIARKYRIYRSQNQLTANPWVLDVT